MSLKIDLKEKGRALAYHLREYHDLLVAYYGLDEKEISKTADKILDKKDDNPYFVVTLCKVLYVMLEGGEKN